MFKMYLNLFMFNHCTLISEKKNMKHNILGEQKHLCFYLFLENEIKIRYIFLRIKNFSLEE